LRVLFLGQINLRKGAAMIVEALRLLRSEPVEFWFIGPRQIDVPADCLSNKQAHWLADVPRGEVHRYYRHADVFLFPTFSDGFGLTQLEAQAWKLPIIASRFCGSVVRDGVNGLILDRVSGRAIADTIRSLVSQTDRLTSMSRQAILAEDFGIDKLGSNLLQVVAS
jgi:glycosyltransferase involved in cell wall biosynthesis